MPAPRINRLRTNGLDMRHATWNGAPAKGGGRRPTSPAHRTKNPGGDRPPERHTGAIGIPGATMEKIMTTRNEVSETRERFTEDQGESGGPRSPRPFGDAMLVLAAALVVVISLGVLFAGCGQHDDSSVSATSSNVSSAPSVGTTQVASAVPVAVPSAPVATSDSTALQPDFVVSVLDTLVLPGQVVEFTAQGTKDLVSLTLNDGRDRPVAMLCEPGGDTWHAQYRVPLQPRHERFGVSLTGRNEAGRWRRTWVFLHVAKSDAEFGDE
jgi:hypothetical protein